MCDTWVAMGDNTSGGNVIFAKNSDRPIFDCQPLLHRPRQTWPPGSRIQTEYVDLPQVEVTFAHLGSSPYWCWGYEEGMNEWGVVIGNEAIFTKDLRNAEAGYREGGEIRLGLLGMDMIRLALERCQTARQAVELMGALVEEYGQFGSGSPGKPHVGGSYDNSFIAADPNEAWVLEMTGRRWAAKRLRQGCTSISNEPSIRTTWDLGSPDLRAYALGKGWWTRKDERARKDEWAAEMAGDFDFARAYIDEGTPRQLSHIRAMRSRQLLAESRGEVTPRWMMHIARDHYEGSFLQGPYFDAADPDFLSLCMHVSPADFTWGNTASSCVTVLPKQAADLPVDDLPVLWWTPGPPCTGCYVPFFVHGSRLPEIVSRAGGWGKRVVPADQAGEDTFAPDSYWWLFRRLTDWTKGDPLKSVPGCYQERHPLVRERFDALERSFEDELPEVVRRAVAARAADPAEMARILDEFTERCVRRVVEEAVSRSSHSTRAAP